VLGVVKLAVTAVEAVEAPVPAAWTKPTDPVEPGVGDGYGDGLVDGDETGLGLGLGDGDGDGEGEGDGEEDGDGDGDGEGLGVGTPPATRTSFMAEAPPSFVVSDGRPHRLSMVLSVE